jgi:tRNA(adenine34) deaminase
MEFYTDEYFMKLALLEAQNALRDGEVPVGCLVVCNQQIIARSYNLTQKLIDVTAHAEMQAITIASNVLGGKYLPNCTLYVTVEPCVMCAGALGWAQVGKLVYGASDPKKGFSLLAPQALHPKTKVVAGVMEKECSELMRFFFSSKRI